MKEIQLTKYVGSLESETYFINSKERNIPHSLASSYFKMDQKRIMDSGTESGHKPQEYLQRIPEMALSELKVSKFK